MLHNPLIELIESLRLPGMKQAFIEQDKQDIAELSFEERFSLLLEREKTYRENKRLTSRLKQAKLKYAACVEDIDYRAQRGLKKSIIMSMYDAQWVKQHRNILIVGPCGTGKTYLACALAHKACLGGYSAKYWRVSRFFQDMLVTRADGSYSKWMQRLAKTSVLILDDWGLASLDNMQRRDLLEVLDDRYQQSSTILTSQMPINLWHDSVGDPTFADAILDRVLHNAHQIILSGESMRKQQVKLEKEVHSSL